MNVMKFISMLPTTTMSIQAITTDDADNVIMNLTGALIIRKRKMLRHILYLGIELVAMLEVIRESLLEQATIRLLPLHTVKIDLLEHKELH